MLMNSLGTDAGSDVASIRGQSVDEERMRCTERHPPVQSAVTCHHQWPTDQSTFTWRLVVKDMYVYVCVCVCVCPYVYSRCIEVADEMPQAWYHQTLVCKQHKLAHCCQSRWTPRRSV